MWVSQENVFEHAYEVTADDIDYLGHASNISVVRWIQEVAVAHSDSVGFDFAAYQRMGAIFVIRRHEIDYLRSALRGDVLAVRTWIHSAAAAKTVRMTEVYKHDGTLMTKAETTWGFIDVLTGRPTRIPDHVRTAFSQPARGRDLAARS